MKKLTSFLMLACCGLWFTSVAHASYHAGCTLVTKVLEVHKSCFQKGKPGSECSLKLKVIAIGKQTGLGQNFCTRKGFLGKTMQVATVKPHLKRPAFTTGWAVPKQGAYYSARLNIKVPTVLKKNMLLLVRYSYADGRSPKGIAQSESWNILRSYKSDEPEATKQPAKKPAKPTVAPVKTVPLKVPTKR